MLVVWGVGVFILWFSVVWLPFCSTPLTMGLSLGGFSIAVVAGIVFYESGWLGVLVGLVCVSGLNVLFLYFVATSLGKKPVVGKRLMWAFFLSGFIMWFFWTVLSGGSCNVEGGMLSVVKLCVFYSDDVVYVLCFLGLLLFFIMVGVVKLSGRSCGPLRGFY